MHTDLISLRRNGLGTSCANSSQILCPCLWICTSVCQLNKVISDKLRFLQPIFLNNQQLCTLPMNYLCVETEIDVMLILFLIFNDQLMGSFSFSMVFFQGSWVYPICTFFVWTISLILIYIKSFTSDRWFSKAKFSFLRKKLRF